MQKNKTYEFIKKLLGPDATELEIEEATTNLQGLRPSHQIGYTINNLLVDTSFDSQDLAKRQVFAFLPLLYTFLCFVH